MLRSITKTKTGQSIQGPRDDRAKWEIGTVRQRYPKVGRRLARPHTGRRRAYSSREPGARARPSARPRDSRESHPSASLHRERQPGWPASGPVCAARLPPPGTIIAGMPESARRLPGPCRNPHPCSRGARINPVRVTEITCQLSRPSEG